MLVLMDVGVGLCQLKLYIFLRGERKTNILEARNKPG